MSLPVTEDTPPDMLAGSMDLKVVLPDGKNVKMSVQRGTPMMDLLVQVTTAHCLSPGDYSLQAMGDRGVMPFKPNTPIGALDTFTVKIVEKKLHSRGRAPQVPQSFLNTFRLQVHLPRSQLFVLRVTPDVTLSEIMTHICTEKNLNIEKYEFRNPGNLDEVLELDKTLGYYKLQELSMMSKGNRAVTGMMSSADILSVKSSKHRQNSVCDSSLSSGSFGSRSGSPIPPMNVVTMPPQPPMRKKRRPAPKPPTFADKEKKDQTTGSVLISHSRESSDSSGYHEASVLSESPTHGIPAGRIDGDSPPDTLPRRSKLPPSQSFTNLTSIQPVPKNRLTSSVSNTSLNSTGHPRKKRAPPPPPAQPSKENKMKSSTLPTSFGERRNGAGESPFRHFQVDSPVEVSNAKVQNPVENASETIHETKASKDEVPACIDVDVRLPPKPKPRTSIPKTPMMRTDERISAGPDAGGEELPGRLRSLNRWKNFENLAEEKSEEKENKIGRPPVSSVVKPRVGAAAVKNGLVAERQEPSREEPSPEGNQDQTDNDSINWEYQLPPPPTDFRDTNSPSCTEFGTITITPEVLENVGDSTESHRRSLPEKKFSQNKSVVMNELTNILHGNGKFKEKSLSVSNLYISEQSPKDYKKNGLNYSRSFSIEPVTASENFKLSAYKGGESLGNNRKTSASNNEITYRNYKNLEKSSSMECIQVNHSDGYKIIDKPEDVFRKPVAPVQKKLKVAKRSASSAGTNPTSHQKRNSLEVSSNGDWADDENIHILREQFIEFLKEKKLNSDLKMKSLDVIRNILPELSQETGTSRVNLVINQSNERHSQTSQMEEKKKEKVREQEKEKEKKEEEEKVKIVEVKVKSPVSTSEGVPESRREEDKKQQSFQERKQPVTKQYSYQGPPSINFGTWGERPKTTKIVIKDEDYVTQEKVTEKTTRNWDVPVNQKPKEVKKPAQIIIKKPGVLSRYEMFSALPRRKEVSSLELVHMEDEEKKRKSEKSEAKEFSRVPVVCGMELKKEFKAPTSPVKLAQEPEIQKPKHSVSVYVNGNHEPERDKTATAPASSFAFIQPKRNSALMPVVKGFRPLEENHVSVSGSHVTFGSKREPAQEGKQTNGVVPVPPPPPPNISLIKLKPVSSGLTKQKSVSEDPRAQLLDEIRNFSGLRKLKRSTVY